MSYQAYLKLEGISGDCAEPGHKDWMVLESFNQNVNGPQERGGRAAMTDIAVIRPKAV